MAPFRRFSAKRRGSRRETGKSLKSTTLLMKIILFEAPVGTRNALERRLGRKRRAERKEKGQREACKRARGPKKERPRFLEIDNLPFWGPFGTCFGTFRLKNVPPETRTTQSLKSTTLSRKTVLFGTPEGSQIRQKGGKKTKKRAARREKRKKTLCKRARGPKKEGP